MKLKVLIKNFQSIKDGKLSFPEGITLITGANNSGKSAVFRAINALLTNDGIAKNFISSGKKKAMVYLQIDNNTPVVWIRSEKSVIYRYGDDNFTKVGRKNIFDLVDLPDINFVIKEGRLINYHSENNLLFPFEFSETQMFKMFEEIFCISDTSIVLKILKEKESEAIKKQENLKETYKNTLKKLEKISVFKSSVDILELKTLTDNLINLKNSLLLLQQKLNRVEKIQNIFKYESCLNVDLVQFDISSLLIIQEKLNQVLKLKEKIEKIEVIQKEDFDFDLKIDIEDLKNISEKMEKFNSLTLKNEEIVSEIKEIDKDLEILNKKIKTFKNCPVCGTKLIERRKNG